MKLLIKMAKEDSSFRRKLIAASKRVDFRKLYYDFADSLDKFKEQKDHEDIKGDGEFMQILKEIEKSSKKLVSYLNKMGYRL